MARLNEAPLNAESVDVLKRRFLRQNRELAKNNSTQSVRIRCLEAEVSRLLSENLHLREKILQLRNDLEGAPNTRAVGGIKGQLELKIQELGRLVADLGSLQDGMKSRGTGTFTRFPTVGWGRGTAELLDGSDGRLPAIKEDKSYPRRTMDADEMRNLADPSSESPVLGSPPVAHFHNEDPIKYDPPPQADNSKESEDMTSLPSNLETRRKKRDSSSKLAVRRMSVFNSPPELPESATDSKVLSQTLPIRAGAKRKLSSREEDSKLEAKSSEDFTYRKASGTSESEKESSAKEDKVKGETKKISSRPQSREEKRAEAKTSAPKLSERKALGDKSVNTDPVASPKKATRKTTISEEKPAVKKLAETAKELTTTRSTRERRSAITGLSTENPAKELRELREARLHFVFPTAQEELPEVAEIMAMEPSKPDLPPKTPATIADLFSAPSTEDSSKPQSGRDTPPPGDLAGADGNGRPGRRARAQVNYAEPNLISKMRRPTKELADAVGKDGKPIPGTVSGKCVSIKTESSDDGAWKNLPATTEPGSPLSKKSTGVVQPTETEKDECVRTHLDTRPSAASAAIAALIQDSKTASRRKSSLLRPERDELERKDRGSSIYDFTSSSPPRSAIASSRPSSRSSDREDEKARAGGGGRRHSSISGSGLGKASILDPAKAGTRFGAGHKKTGSANPGTTTTTTTETEGLRASSRRKSMML